MRKVAAMFAIALLAGCGFRPLYGTKSFDRNIGADLSSIHVIPLSDRPGQLVHNALLVRLNPDGEPRRPRYELQVTVTPAEAQVALQRDQTATRDEVTYSVHYVLYEEGSRIPVTTGRFTRILSYDYLQQHYANVVAAQDIQNRSAEEIANEIRDRMATYFVESAEARAAEARALRQAEPAGE